MKLRCTIDGLLLDAVLRRSPLALIAFDGDEGFALEAVEALYYEVVEATPEELLSLQQMRYRLLRMADDFHTARA
ncbi:MAG: hypothetical protein K2R98_10005 [Gemmataceae bacterium]|nr:hypothetical protein [Gemmataceae bacterium]